MIALMNLMYSNVNLINNLDLRSYIYAPPPSEPMSKKKRGCMRGEAYAYQTDSACLQVTSCLFLNWLYPLSVYINIYTKNMMD